MRIALLAVVAVVIGASCGPAVPLWSPAEYAKEPDPRSKELVLGVGDVLSINVWDNTNLNTESTVRPDGTITMPLVGDLKAAGETPSALQSKIKDALTRFLKLPAGNEVTVAVKSWKSYRFTIEGEVGKPGYFTSDQYLRVDAALALAGGLTRFARRNSIKLFRTDPKTGNTRTIPFDYDQLISGKRPDMNIYVLPGDVISVPD